MENGGNESKNVDIMFGGIHGDSVLQSIVGRRSFPQILGRSYKILVGD